VGLDLLDELAKELLPFSGLEFTQQVGGGGAVFRRGHLPLWGATRRIVARRVQVE
jgi:hypothetical protein